MPKNYFVRRCVEGCEQFGSPSCPVCPEGQICSLLAPTCDECQRTVCVAQSAAPQAISTPSQPSKIRSDVGAITGGTIAGVVCIIFATYLVWRYCIKARRSHIRSQDLKYQSSYQIETEKSFTTRRDARSSIHTIGSLASSVLTRASNVIQIAYIPGVTNRSTPTSPGCLVPPVPPIPLGLSTTNDGNQHFEQEHFFMPSDLRASTYSTMTSQTSYDRYSVASTIYGKNAVVSPVPAQTGIRGKAAVISVRSANAVEENIPPVPQIDYSDYGDRGIPSPTFSIGSTFLSRANEATHVKPQVVRVKKNSISQFGFDSEEFGGRGNQIVSFIDTSSRNSGPFSDPTFDLSTPSGQNEDEKKTLKDTLNNYRTQVTTPFGDENEVKES